MPDLSGRAALVTGTAHGIGAAILRALEVHGATAHGVDRDTVDVADPGQVAALVERIGRIDILVNNAGGVCGQVGKPLEEVPDDDWREIVDANLTSTFVCTRAVVPAMKEAGYGRIVNISSGAGRSVRSASRRGGSGAPRTSPTESSSSSRRSRPGSRVRCSRSTAGIPSFDDARAPCREVETMRASAELRQRGPWRAQAGYAIVAASRPRARTA